MNQFIIGSGAIAAIVKLYFPAAVVIAPGGRNFLPVHLLWDTPEVRKFLAEFDIDAEYKIQKVGSYQTPEERALYNKITHKPERNTPSEGKKEIGVWACELPDVQPDIKAAVTELFENCAVCKVAGGTSTLFFDRAFVCSPLLFSPYNVKYYGLKIYKFQQDSPGGVDWDYAYLGGHLLRVGVYRVNHDGEFFYAEQAEGYAASPEEIRVFLCEVLKFKLKLVAQYPHPFAHFDPQPQVKNTKSLIMASRLSNLDNNFLMSDTIKLMQEIRDHE